MDTGIRRQGEIDSIKIAGEMLTGEIENYLRNNLLRKLTSWGFEAKNTGLPFKGHWVLASGFSVADPQTAANIDAAQRADMKEKNAPLIPLLPQLTIQVATTLTNEAEKFWLTIEPTGDDNPMMLGIDFRNAANGQRLQSPKTIIWGNEHNSLLENEIWEFVQEHAAPEFVTHVAKVRSCSPPATGPAPKFPV